MKVIRRRVGGSLTTGDRTSLWVNRLVTALSVVAEFAAIYLWSMWAHAHGLLHRGGLPWIILFTIAVLASTVLHECGHAVLAWGFYMKLLSFNAGPFQWRKVEGRWTFKLHPAGVVSLGGSVNVVPTHPEQPRTHDIWMIAAGPLANILFGSLFLWAVLHANWPRYMQTWELVAFTSSFCFIAAVTNLLPFQTEDGGYSDGARILQILTNSPLDDYHRTMSSLQSTMVTERRYRDLDIAAIERAASRFPSELRGLHLQLCASNYFQDAGRLSEARAALAAAEEIYNGFAIDLPAPLHTVFVLGHACLNHNATAARLWWDRMEARKPKRLNVDYWLARTALLWIEGDLAGAKETWQKADAEAQKLPEFGAYEFDRSRCALLRQELDKGLPAPAVLPFAPAKVFRIASSPAAGASVVSASSAALALSAVPAASSFPVVPAASALSVAPGAVVLPIVPAASIARVGSAEPVAALAPAVKAASVARVISVRPAAPAPAMANAAVAASQTPAASANPEAAPAAATEGGDPLLDRLMNLTRSNQDRPRAFAANS